MLHDCMTEDFFKSVKQHINITWSDPDTDQKVYEMMCDAEIRLNHILGAELDYPAPGPARTLYKNYMLYLWNDCGNEFVAAYRGDIYELQNMLRIRERKDNA